MPDFETKYNELLVAVANMRKLQKDNARCKTSQGVNAAKRAENKVDELINAEIGKAIQLQQAMKF